MKQRLAFKSSNLLVSVLLLLLIQIAGSSCAKRIVFPVSDVVPAAVGKIKINTDQNKNYAIDIKVKNLTEPDRLQPSRRYYVVWMETEGNGVKNLGRLISSSSLFSKKLKAAMETVTPFRPTRIFITAEDDVSIRYPGLQVVLRTNYFRM